MSPPVDIQATLTVLSRRDANYDRVWLDLHGANLRGANLHGADLKCAKTDGDTRMPDGVVRPAGC